jgi:hypothetical protein
MLYFTVGGRSIDKYGRVRTDIPDLIAGQTYYITIIQQDSVGGNDTCVWGSSCDINYALYPN